MGNNMGNNPNAPTTDLFLVRHGRTDWNAEGRFQGSVERPLDEHGYAQAEAAAGRLSSLNAIYCSHMLRARQTAEVIAQKHTLPIVCAYELREGTYGPIDGMTWEDFKTQYAREIEERDSLPPAERFQYRIIEGAESSADILGRALPCLQALSRCHAGQRIAVVTHGWVMRTLILYFTNFLHAKVHIENGAILHLRGDGENFSIVAHEGVLLGEEK
jgi:probable phosphoglycerate mutase